MFPGLRCVVRVRYLTIVQLLQDLGSSSATEAVIQAVVAVA